MTNKTDLDTQLEALEEFIARRRDVVAFVMARYPKMPASFWQERIADTHKKLACAEARATAIRVERSLLPAEPPRNSYMNPRITQEMSPCHWCFSSPSSQSHPSSWGPPVSCTGPGL